MKTLWLILLALFLGGCSAAPDGQLQGAANPIPLFQPSRLQDYRLQKTEWVGTNKRETNEWTWKTTSATADVVTFYKKELPAATVTSDGAEGTVFRWTSFPEAEVDEAVNIVVSKDGTIRISECLAPHKHKRRDEIVKAFPPDNDLPKDKKNKK